MASPITSRIPSGRERTLSLGVLAVLGGVLVWIFWQQGRFSPAVTVAATMAQNAAKPGVAAPAAAAKDLLNPWPAEWRPMSAAEAFTPATLSDKIDGKAELYLPAGFVGMTCQRVALRSAPESWLEVLVFDMGKPANAFAVFSAQQRQQATPAGFGDYGYLAGNQLVLVHGQYYIELVAAEAKAATMTAATGLAKALIAATAVTNHADVSSDQSLFPAEGLVADSIQLLSVDVFGSDQLKDFFVASYQEGADRMTLFIASRASPAEAAQTAEVLRAFLVKDYDGKPLNPPAAPAGAILIDLGGGVCDGFFVQGARVGGVHQAPSRAAAERMLLRLAQRLPAK